MVREWMSKHPTHIEAAVTMAFWLCTAALSGLISTFAPEGGAGLPVLQPPPGLDPKARATFKQASLMGGSASQTVLPCLMAMRCMLCVGPYLVCIDLVQ
uniref:Uncharacterized protein n=1 Tax=Aegilops tauschii subsp. strangulata TaxID=200361 RepID=A0A453SZN2_AEGTS